MKRTYDQGYIDGRKCEAEITLDNLYMILDDLTIQTLMSCIRDLERDLGVQPREDRHG